MLTSSGFWLERTPKHYQHVSLGLPGACCCHNPPTAPLNTESEATSSKKGVISDVPSPSQS